MGTLAHIWWQMVWRVMACSGGASGGPVLSGVGTTHPREWQSVDPLVDSVVFFSDK
jgi:hypothetical protein